MPTRITHREGKPLFGPESAYLTNFEVARTRFLQNLRRAQAAITERRLNIVQRVEIVRSLHKENEDLIRIMENIMPSNKGHEDNLAACVRQMQQFTDFKNALERKKRKK